MSRPLGHYLDTRCELHAQGDYSMNAQPYLSMAPADLYKLCCWREARGESLDAKRAQAHSVMNRVNLPSWWGHDLSSVILCKWQFSSFNEGDPNEKKWPDDNDPSFIDCSTVCDAILSGTDEDPTSGADSYYDTSIPEPYWAVSAQLTLEVDHFRFFVTR